MPAPKLTAEAMQDDEAALGYLEAVLWPNGPVCPHCGATYRIYTLKGRSTRLGVRKCGHCRKPFTVTVDTVMERSHIPLHKWVQAFYLLCCSKKGISSHQLHRMLGVSYKAAWFMSHRIREAMRDGSLGPLGSANTPVEADETFIGRKEGVPIPKGGYSRVHHTMGEYVDPEDATINTNTIEGYFSIFKRGMKGVYQHCAETHPHCYLAEFDFRYNNCVRLGVEGRERADSALAGIKGKRLTYRRTDETRRP